jgi:hypothetical protein
VHVSQHPAPGPSVRAPDLQSSGSLPAGSVCRPEAACNLRGRLDDLRPFPPLGASPTSAPFRVAYSPVCPVARRLAVGGIRSLGDPVLARASVRLAPPRLAMPCPDGVVLLRTTETRSGWALALPRGDASAGGEGQTPSLIAHSSPCKPLPFSLCALVGANPTPGYRAYAAGSRHRASSCSGSLTKVETGYAFIASPRIATCDDIAAPHTF